MNNAITWPTLPQSVVTFLQDNALGLLTTVAIIMVVGRIAIIIANRYLRQEEVQHNFRKWVRYITLISVMVWILLLYNSHTQKDTPFYLFFVGVFLAGIAISMRDVFSNVVGWFVIISNKGFRSGDRIRIGDLSGDVIDIGMLRTVVAEIGGWVHADQSTGRLVSVPNSLVLTKEVYNYTQGYDFIWNEMRVLVTFESNWKKAEQIMMSVADEDFEQKREQIQDRLSRVRRKYLLRYSYISPNVYVHIADSGVELALRYMVRARRRRTLEDAFSRQILERFALEKDIDFAYPTFRVYRAGELPGEPVMPR